MNNEDYASYELAKKLKECGFAEPCDHYYIKDNAPDGTAWIVPTTDREDFNADSDCPFCKPLCSAPTLAQVQKWLREKKGIHVDVCIYSDCSTDADGKVCDKWDFWGFELYKVVGGYRMVDDDGEYDFYEQALSAGIASALELIKKGE